MHIGSDTDYPNYKMKQQENEIEIQKVIEEKDLGVLIDNKLKFTSQHPKFSEKGK